MRVFTKLEFPCKIDISKGEFRCGEIRKGKFEMIEKSTVYKQKAKRILTISLITGIASQLSLHFFDGSFIASLGVICIPAAIFLLDDVDIIPTAFLSAAFILALRVLMHLIQYGVEPGLLNNYLPETVFYMLVGIFWYIFDALTGHSRKLSIFMPGMMIIDYLGNEMEMFARLQAGAEFFVYQYTLIMIVCVRGLVLFAVLKLAGQYGIMLMSKTHAERYQRLIMLISNLSGEVVWMNKNFDQIERAMSVSYKLYDSLKESGNDDAAKDALTLAKDIHEIKKEYRLISQGISENLKRETKDGMEMQELLNILIQSVQNQMKGSGKSLSVNVNLEERLFVENPYLYLSVFHNLMTNSIDAAEEACIITISEKKEGSRYVFEFADEGPGVAEEYRNWIFEPRFSTKIDYTTGNVSRGLGLPIVKGIIEERLGGKIVLKRTNKGATFEIRLPEIDLEVVKG